MQVVASSSGSATVQMGTGTGTGFQPGIIGVSNSNLSAGGTSSLTVSLMKSDGTLFTGSADIVFDSACIAGGQAQIRFNGVAVPSVTTTTGLATVTYAATGCSGSDAITATSTVNSQSLSASGALTVAAATAGSIEFVSATPPNNALKGTGDSSRPESSVVAFRVRDASNAPVQGAIVQFALNTVVGGINMTNASATSDNQGVVSTVVNAGTVATSVRVTATVPAANISTQSSQLTVTTGIPTAASSSLAVGCYNIEGWDFDGVTTTVTARLGDRFQNPVPDGTAVTFTSEGGNILSQCTTITTPAEGGVCTVNYRSSNPRPSDGRVTLLAKAIGEESFVDANGNGSFDNGESFTDLPEPFRDDNEDAPVAVPPDDGYDPGEDFFDFNNNQTRNAADGVLQRRALQRQHGALRGAEIDRHRSEQPHHPFEQLGCHCALGSDDSDHDGHQLGEDGDLLGPRSPRQRDGRGKRRIAVGQRARGSGSRPRRRARFRAARSRPESSSPESLSSPSR